MCCTGLDQVSRKFKNPSSEVTIDPRKGSSRAWNVTPEHGITTP
jgi:hypothetical protein